MKKSHQKDLIDRCADLAANAQHIKHYIFLWETDDGAIHRASMGSRVAQVGLLKIYADRITDDFRDFINAPKEGEE